MPVKSENDCVLVEARRDKWCRTGTRVMPLKQLGVHWMNRGSLGRSVAHVLRLVLSIRDHGIIENRYRDVYVVKVPTALMGKYRTFNKHLCEYDPVMPPFSPVMDHDCITKNHLTSAVKLFAAGSVTYPGTEWCIRPDTRDAMLIAHVEHGMICVVFPEQSWFNDETGLLAVMNEDQAGVYAMMSMSEMEALRLTQTCLSALSYHTLEKPEARFQALLLVVRMQTGIASCSDSDITCVYNMACVHPPRYVKIMCEVHFAMVSPALSRLHCDALTISVNWIFGTAGRE